MKSCSANDTSFWSLSYRGCNPTQESMDFSSLIAERGERVGENEFTLIRFC